MSIREALPDLLLWRERVTFYENVTHMKSPSLLRFGVSLEAELLKRFDKFLSRSGYTTRSEALRDLIRARLVEERVRNQDASAVGVLSLVYDHHQRELEERLTGVQHDHHHHIVSTTHVHLDHENCLEVIILKGTVGKVRSIGALLTSFKGVKHSELVLTTIELDPLAKESS
jgi:CopG family transcriptional regulator, nickel-responsive regulator